MRNVFSRTPQFILKIAGFSLMSYAPFVCVWFFDSFLKEDMVGRKFGSMRFRLKRQRLLLPPSVGCCLLLWLQNSKLQKHKFTKTCQGNFQWLHESNKQETESRGTWLKENGSMNENAIYMHFVLKIRESFISCYVRKYQEGHIYILKIMIMFASVDVSPANPCGDNIFAILRSITTFTTWWPYGHRIADGITP